MTPIPEPSLVVLAHPLTEAAELPFSPLVLGLLAVYVLFNVSAVAAWRRRSRKPTPREPATRQHDDDPVPQGTGPRAAFWVARALGLALFVLALVAGVWGDPNQVRNIAPALTVGAGWPMVTLAALLFGGVWWWVNPYDTLARIIAPLGAGDGSGRAPDGTWAPIWWAVASASVWMAYLTVWPDALDPRTIGWALIAYTLVTSAGCLAVGRKTWLWRGEFFTIFFGLMAAVRTRGTSWTPPAGAPAVLGVVAGAALFGVFRDSDLGIFLAYGPRANLYGRIAVVIVMAVTAAAAHAAARRTNVTSVVVGLAPMAAALVVALSISRNRLTTSLQLLPIAASNPLGGDVDLFGTRFNTLQPRPLGEVGPVWLQAGLLLIGALAGLWLAHRAADRPAPDPRSARQPGGVVLLLLGTLLGVGVAAAAAI